MFKDKYNRPDLDYNSRESIVNMTGKSTNDYRYDGMSQETFVRLGTPGTSMMNSKLQNHVAILKHLAQKGKTHVCDSEIDRDILIGDEIKAASESELTQVNEIVYEVLRRIKNHIV
jgi:hypothetical protein